MKGERELSGQVEFEEVVVKIPKPIMNLLRAFKENPNNYLTYAIVGSVKSDLENDLPCGKIFDFSIVDQYNLKAAFKAVLEGDC